MTIPADYTETCKQRLNQAREAIATQHPQQTDIEQTIRQTAEQIDALLIDAWNTHFPGEKSVSLLAVGGYGRRELNIHSDIDLLFLHEFKTDIEQSLEHFGLDTFIQFLWDIGLEVGHSVRSISESMEMANQDITIMTNMLEARLLCGNQTLFDAFEQQIRQHSSWTNASFFQAKVDEQTQRYERFDDTTYKLEPNIKKSPGGLRDIQTIGWVANKIYGTSDPDSLQFLGLLTDDELALFKDSRNTLWSLRNALHLQAGRAEDRLLFSHQQDIAASYDLEDKAGQLAIEQLMQQYYRAAHDIRRLNELILQLIDEQLHHHDGASQLDISNEFYIRNGYLSNTDPRVFQQNPDLLLEVFSLFQIHHESLKGFSANCARAIREARDLIDKDFRNRADHLETFCKLFKQEIGLTHTLRKMHEYGVLGAFMPIFRKIEGQMQHDLFHAYTVDAHTLMVIRNLRRCTLDRFAEELPTITQLAQKTNKRYRLYLAALFHDIAKGRGGNHDKLGAIDALAYCEKLGLPQADSDLIAWLVLNHLQMSKVSQREDLSDPQTIQNFADLVGDQESLDNLYLLTVADIRGTSTTTWTAWKGHLLGQLHAATHELFEQQASGEIDPATQIRNRQTETLVLLGATIPPATLDQYWEMLDDEYFLIYSPQTISWHATAICHASALDLPIVETRYISELEAEQYLIYTADSDILLSTIAGVIDRFSQNIVQARIHSANPGFTVLIFTVTNQLRRPDDEILAEHAFEARLALLQARDHPAPIKKMLPRRLKQFEFKPRVSFSDDGSGQSTILSITALDQAGLIHLISTALAKCRVRLISAHITTAGEKAEDRFIICQPNARMALTEEQIQCLSQALLDTL